MRQHTQTEFILLRMRKKLAFILHMLEQGPQSFALVFRIRT